MKKRVVLLISDTVTLSVTETHMQVEAGHYDLTQTQVAVHDTATRLHLALACSASKHHLATDSFVVFKKLF